VTRRPLRVAIFGATSGIAHAAGREWAREGASFFLAARHEGKLDAVARDLAVRGATSVRAYRCELANVSTHRAMVDELMAGGIPLDRALIAWGTLPDQQQVEANPEQLADQFTINATSVLALTGRLVGILERQGHGSVAVLGSVAGDRGRRSNYVYGAAKAAIDVFMAGVRARLRGSGASAILVKPGFVRTPMTAHLPASPLVWEPESVARAIVHAMEGRSRVLYTPFFWRFVMQGIRMLPEPVMQRMRF
jgi:decaprenylphospho-beta-D-erythro-pentofuranosid-2-ulose 2-reductase